MLRQNTNALGIIFPNSYDNTVPELVTERAMASIPFAGRYRMVDFVLSSMANCGISNVSIVVRKNYHSLRIIWAPAASGIWPAVTAA